MINRAWYAEPRLDTSYPHPSSFFALPLYLLGYASQEPLRTPLNSGVTCWAYMQGLARQFASKTGQMLALSSHYGSHAASAYRHGHTIHHMRAEDHTLFSCGYRFCISPAQRWRPFYLFRKARSMGRTLFYAFPLPLRVARRLSGYPKPKMHKRSHCSLLGQLGYFPLNIQHQRIA